VSLTDRDRKLLIVIVPIVLIVAYWFLLLAPKREEASTAGDELSKQEQRRDAAEAAASSANGAKQTFASDYAQIVRLGKAIPAELNMPSLLVQLDRAAAGTGITFTKIATGDRQTAGPATTSPPSTGSESGDSGTPVAAGGDEAQSQPGGAVESANDAQQTANEQSATATSTGGGQPGTASSARPGLESVPLELEFVGNFFNLADFFHRMKRFVRVANQDVVVGGRLITVDGVRWESDSEIFPRIRASMTATIYLSPKTQGATAGASPAGPAPTTASTGSSPDSPALAPTASATP
jgi:Tfp pilus assembly protein PilO